MTDSSVPASLKRKSGWGYRLLLWSYRIQDRLGVDKPGPHLKAASLKPGMTVVDWGCGPGRYTVLLAKRVGKKGKVFAVDVEPLAIKEVEEKAARASVWNVEAILIDGYRVPLRPTTVDCVLLLDVFHVIDDPNALLREIHRILKPSGHLFMDPGHMKLSTAMERVDASGLFTLVKQQGNHMVMAPKRSGERDRRP